MELVTVSSSHLAYLHSINRAGNCIPMTPIFPPTMHPDRLLSASTLFLQTSWAPQILVDEASSAPTFTSTTTNPSSAHFWQGSGSNVFFGLPALYSSGTTSKSPGPFPNRES